jgi:ubiquitin carboxyl-terminal hydrolase 8
MYLSVPIPVKEKSPTLEMCVKEFTREEILDGLDMWKCPRCKSFERARKKIDIWKLPSVLIVHLKRFEFTERRSGKINSLVHFPINNLDLAPYVSRMQKDKPLYDLFSVMVSTNRFSEVSFRITRVLWVGVTTTHSLSTATTRSGIIRTMRMLDK